MDMVLHDRKLMIPLVYSMLLQPSVACGWRWLQVSKQPATNPDCPLYICSISFAMAANASRQLSYRISPCPALDQRDTGSRLPGDGCSLARSRPLMRLVPMHNWKNHDLTSLWLSAWSLCSSLCGSSTNAASLHTHLAEFGVTVFLQVNTFKSQNRPSPSTTYALLNSFHSLSYQITSF